jgi:acyl carrier protein
MPRDLVERDRPFRTMGLDSLMMVELRNLLNAALGTSIGTSDVFNHPTVARLATWIAAQLGPAPVDERAVAPAPGDDLLRQLLEEAARTPESRWPGGAEGGGTRDG